jgi:hypothetical protein
MAKITETELRRKLRAGGTGTGSSSGPSASRAGSTWEYTDPVLYLAYADSLTNITTSGTIPLQTDAVGFGYTPFNSTGTLKQWRGYLFSKSIYASGDPTDYIWEDVSATASSVTYTRYYSGEAFLSSEMGDPDNPGTGVTWTLIAAGSAIPAAAYWLSEKYEFNGSKSSWNLIPIKSKSTGTPLAFYTITGRNKPTLSSAQWSTDALVAMTAHTGDSYSSVVEFGYGTAVVIEYDDGKQYGLWKSVSGTGTWSTPTSFVDGDLLVNGSVNADQIAANSISTDKLQASAITADKIAASAITADKIAAGSVTSTKVNLVPADVGAGSSSSSGERLLISSNRIDIYDASNNLRIRLGEL